MAPRYEYSCTGCVRIFEETCPVDERHERKYCYQCDANTGVLIPSTISSYAIKGDNSASVTPKNRKSTVKR